MKIPQWFWDFMRRRTYPMPFTGWDYFDVVQISWKAYQKGKRDRGACEWHFDGSGYYTSCGSRTCIDSDFCPWCGKRIKIKESK